MAERVETVDEETGERVTIYRVRSFIRAGSLDDPGARIEGLSSYRTADGGPVNVTGEGQYEIVRTGRKLRGL